MNDDHTRARSERDVFSVLLDIILTFWCLVVAITFYGGYLAPDTVGVQTGNMSGIYAALVLLTACVLALRYLRGRPGAASGPGIRSFVEQSAGGARSTGESELDR